MQQLNPLRGFLVSVGVAPEILVMFQYNPAQLIDKRTVSYTTLNAAGLIFPVRQYTQGGDRTITFTVRVDGLYQGPADLMIPILRAPDGNIGPELNKYRSFLYPRTPNWLLAVGSFSPLYSQSRNFETPPLCLFGFGTKLLDCVVTEVSITENLFNATLSPLRADVSITLVERSPYGGESPMPFSR